MFSNHPPHILLMKKVETKWNCFIDFLIPYWFSGSTPIIFRISFVNVFDPNSLLSTF